MNAMDASEPLPSELPWPQLFAAWIENAPDGLLVADGESLTLLRANPACRRLLELALTDLPSRSLADILLLLNPSLSAEDVQSLLENAAVGEIVQMRIDAPSLEASLRHQIAAGKPFFLLTLRDTTAQKTLSQVITEKEEQLRSAIERALESQNLKSEFMGTMSHELRTPLNAIIGMTELLQGTRLNEPQREYTQIVHDAAQVLFSMINDMLDFSKIEAGRISLELSQFDPRSLTESACESFAARARQKRLGFMTYVDPAIPRVLTGDPARVQQVLSNLVSNAIKFTHQGQVVVRAFLQEEREHLLLLKFEVEDTGIGINANLLPRLFQPFTQIDGSTTRKYGGTGLGLAISRSLVEMMGGEIGAESEAGEGSTFWFTAAFERSTLAELKSPAPALTDVRGLNILLVDDIADHREILRVYLESWGMHCIETDNGTSAIEILRTASRQGRPFDLALIDQDMPEMTGLQLGQQILADPQLVGLRCIMLTGFDRLGQAQSAIQNGFSAYLTKPVKQSSLLDSILTAICGEGALPPEPDPEAPTVSHPEGLVLLVEDHPAARRLLLAQVQKLGYPAEAAANGAEAAQAIASQPGRYWLALMDCQMPELDGFSAARQIRQTEQEANHPRLPIIAMTAQTMPGDREACLEAGMDDYLAKPPALETLQEKLSAWALKCATSGTPPSASPPTAQPTINPATLETLRGLETGLLDDLLNLYLQNSAGQMQRIGQSLLDGDSETARRTTQELRSASQEVGALPLTQLCHDLEQFLASRPPLHTPPAEWGQMQNEYQRVRQALLTARSGWSNH